MNCRVSDEMDHPRPAGTYSSQYRSIKEWTLAPLPKVSKSPFKVLTPDIKAFMRYKGPDGSQKDAWGHFDDLANIAEGRFWVETSEGYRLPHNYFNTKLRFGPSNLEELPIMSPAQIKVNEHGSLFRTEKAEGRHLLLARETDGSDEDPFVTRELTHAELQIVQADGDLDRPLLATDHAQDILYLKWMRDGDYQAALQGDNWLRNFNHTGWDSEWR